MFERRLLDNIKAGEDVRALIRRTPIAAALPIVVTVVLIIAPFFFLYPLLQFGVGGSVLIIGSVSIGVLLGFRTLWVQLNAFIITAARIVDIDQRGFFHKVVSETTFDKIQDVSYVVKGITATVFQYGAVVVQTAGSAANLELDGVRHPQRVQELIVRLQREATAGPGEEHLSADDLLAMVKKIKAGVGEEQFRRLIAHKEPKPRV
jgi:hypothetical protein